jgi:HSP20 family molecular chaperone IbpA
MSRLRWDPFQDLRSAQDEMAEMSPMLAHALGLHGQQQGSATATAWAPPLDISERKDAYVVVVEVPGVKPEDLDITLEDGLLTIQGERQISRKRAIEEYTPSSPEEQLERAYRDLLKEVEPGIAGNAEFAAAFARKLANFTKVWAQDPNNPTALDNQERELLQWLAQQPTQPQAQSTEEEFHRIERRYGRFRRSITLPSSVRMDAIEATFENGVVTIVIPKAMEARPRKVQIRPVGGRADVEGTSR